MAVKVTVDYLKVLRRGDEGVPVAIEDSLLESVPQYCFDLLVALMEKNMLI